MKILIKVSDISNEARPLDVARPWLDCLLQEFFHQVIRVKSIHMVSQWKVLLYVYIVYRAECWA